MKVELFDYNLPRNLIANEPVFPRDSAKMLVVGNCLLDSSVKDLTKFLLPGDIMVFNNTQVIPGRLRGLRDSVSVEVTLIKQIRGNVWRVLARPARRLNPGQVIKFNNDLSAEVIKKYDSDIELSFNLSGKKLLNALDQTGEMPLPPYINQPKNSDFINRKNYQTIYAAIPGAVAAPTAGLHFTEQLFNTIDDYKIKRVFTTLHVGPGTFQPIKVNDTDHHKMHSEVFNIDNETVIEIKNAKARGGRVIAVGTTSLRVLESAVNDEGVLVPKSEETNLFIVPGFKFNVVDILLTNFHLPRSTLLMLVSAFSGSKNILEAYHHAINKRYRFFSYGDACLLSRQT